MGLIYRRTSMRYDDESSDGSRDDDDTLKLAFLHGIIYRQQTREAELKMFEHVTRIGHPCWMRCFTSIFQYYKTTLATSLHPVHVFCCILRGNS